MITDNIATILTNLFIGFYGKNAHKPRWMAVGCIITGLSVSLTALPYFIYGPAQGEEIEFARNRTISKLMSKKSAFQMCNEPVKVDCSDTSRATTMTAVAVAIFALSNFFRGFGTSIYFTFGTPYLDDNVSKAKMPTFFAFIFATRILGAPLGYTISSISLKFYENPLAPPYGLGVSDPRWIGAWWIGFLLSGSCLLLLAIPLSFFPREFKRYPSSRSSIDSENQMVQLGSTDTDIQSNETTNHENLDSEETKPKKTDLSLRDLPNEILDILKNPIVVCQLIGNVFRGIGIIGYFVFQPKYLESQFRQSASKAGLVSGTTGFMAKILGVLFGGFIITLFRPGPKTLTTYIFLVEVTSVLTLLIASSVMGPQYMYPNTMMDNDNLLQPMNECNRDCNCGNVRYQPVCEHSAMNAYFSPCHAGCNQSYPSADDTTTDFIHCKCIDAPSKQLEKCPPDNDRLYQYAMIVALGGMISGSSRSGNMVTFFRSIKQDQKSLAVAVASFSSSLLVSIPYPILFGKIFDSCCMVWSTECGRRGNCWLYDVNKLRITYHSVALTLVALGSIFDLIMIFLSPRLGQLYDEKDLKKETIPKKILRKLKLIDGNKGNPDQAELPASKVM